MSTVAEFIQTKDIQSWVMHGEQLFHAWRSFNFDGNTKTIDSYVMQIRQVATLLGYGESQVLEVFKNMLPTKFYWILFPIEDLREAVETAKRIITKEK